MKTFKITCRSDMGDEYLEVPMKKEFEYMGYKWVVHRPDGYFHENESISKHQKFWKVSEYVTGFSCGSTGRTMDIAKKEAVQRLDEVGKKRIDEAINHVLEVHGPANSEFAEKGA